MHGNACPKLLSDSPTLSQAQVHPHPAQSVLYSLKPGVFAGLWGLP